MTNITTKHSSKAHIYYHQNLVLNHNTNRGGGVLRCCTSAARRGNTILGRNCNATLASSGNRRNKSTGQYFPGPIEHSPHTHTLIRTHSNTHAHTQILTDSALFSYFIALFQSFLWIRELTTDKTLLTKPYPASAFCCRWVSLQGHLEEKTYQTFTALAAITRKKQGRGGRMSWRSGCQLPGEINVLFLQ